MSGGADQIITNTRRSKNTPYITNMEKHVYGSTRKAIDARNDINPNLGENTGDPALTLELYNKPIKNERPIANYSQYIPELWPNKRFSPSAFKYLFDPRSAVSNGPGVEIPIQHVYNINLPGPTGGHVEMNKIYENVLPKRNSSLTGNTLGERLQIYDYIKQILVKINDGEEISLDNSGQNSLLSYIKFMELNPTYYSPISSNPYTGLPFGLLVYRSCFPITIDNASQSIICAKDSMGLNIRLYSLSIAEYYSYKLLQPVRKEYDVWRELTYYQYVRENIIKKRQSPNFPIIYTYFMCPNKNIDFFSLKKNCLTQKQKMTDNYRRFLSIHSILKDGKVDLNVQIDDH